MFMLSPRSNDLRQFERRPYPGTIDCAVSIPAANEIKTVTLKARTIDISDGGIGIQADYPLAPGHTLWLRGIERETGIVKWHKKIDNSYRAGIQMTFPKEAVGLQGTASQVAFFVSEKRARYGEVLDKATDRFIRELEAVEKKCDEGEDAGDILAVVKSETDKVLSVCGEFEIGIRDRDMIRQARIRFHEKTDPVLSKSYLIKRTRTWPQGYQGDYRTLEMIYVNTPRSSSLGYHLDLLGLTSPLAGAVRNRIKELAEILGKELSLRERLSVLNIACGSCRELMGIAPEILSSGARITCVDTDNDALAFAQDRLSYAGIIEQVELRKYNALRMFDEETNLMEFGLQDIIYSVGLFDYLPDDFLIKLLGALYNLLHPRGRLIAAFKDAERYRSQDYHWISDWDGFLQRTEKDFLRIMDKAGIPSSSLFITREETGIIVFYSVVK
jgi:extracellular factor (EF) 3-hydroxypalmitic acid methyl ester biosynthesis protein